jgi:hypothetical protein
VSESDVEATRITYGELCKRADPTCAPIGAGGFLYDIYERCKALGFPPLNSLVVNKKTGKPGGNYPNGLSAWPKDVKECIAFKYPSQV